MEERIREIAERVVEWFSKGENPPYECRLNPTNNCNLKCLPCVSRGRPLFDPKKELSTSEYLRIIRESILIGVKRFDICGGGEPFCREDIVEMMKEIKKLGAYGTISTNGTLLTEKVIREIIEIGWDEVRFSINGPNAKIDDYLRGVEGAFVRSIKAIKLLASLKRKLSSDKPYLILTPIIVSTNYKKIGEFIKLAKKLDADSLIFQPFMSEVLEDFTGVDRETRKKISKELRLNEVQQKEFQLHFKRTRELAKKLSINTNLDFLNEECIELSTAELIKRESKCHKENKLLRIPCYVPWWDLDISAEGEIGPCPRAEKRISIKGRSLKEIWNGEYFNSFRKRLTDGKVFSLCKTCCAISTFDNQKCREVLANLIRSQSM